MDKQKKTALDKMARYYARNCNSCPVNCNNVAKENPDICAKKLKQYFQEKANIPDGWDVVKEIYEYVKATSEGIEKQEKKGIEYSASGSLLTVNILIKNRLEKAGIEVDDE